MDKWEPTSEKELLKQKSSETIAAEMLDMPGRNLDEARDGISDEIIISSLAKLVKNQAIKLAEIEEEMKAERRIKQ